MSQDVPGQVLPDDRAEVMAMLCTAGHVDHGKTQLVKLLTGCATDRLRAEIERGLTIELGFAPCRLGDELGVGIVDVPGHERFIRTMVAGVSGIDFCILVVAADDGVMLQTREHMDIMQLMGLHQGMAVLTKTDLVTPSIVETRIQEIHAFLDSTFLRGAPVCPLSNLTGDGFPVFYDTLVHGVRTALRKRRAGIFRMPVERTFPRPGFGVVVSGIPITGTIQVGDALESVPKGITGHVRGLQCFGHTARSGGAGQCLALNVPEFGKTPPRRGQVLAPPGWITAVRQFHLRLRAVPKLDPPLRNAETITFHSGTAESAGRLYLLETNRLAAGESQFATILTASPIAAAAGDRFIIRRASPPMTAGGGRILHADPMDRRPRRKRITRELNGLETALGEAEWDTTEGRRRRVVHLLANADTPGLPVPAIGVKLLLPQEDVASLVEDLVNSGTLLDLEQGWVAHAGRQMELRARMERQLAAFAAAGQLRIPQSEWRRSLEVPDPCWKDACRFLERAGRVRFSGRFALTVPTLDALSVEDRDLATRMLCQFEREGYETTHPNEIHTCLQTTSGDTARILDYLLTLGKLVRVAPNVVLTAERYHAARDHVVRTILEQGKLESPAFRDDLGVSRKYAMAILDSLDRQKITQRVQNTRRLLPGWEQRLEQKG